MLKQFLSQFDPTNKTISEIGKMVYGEYISIEELKDHQTEELKELKKSLPKTSLKENLSLYYLPSFKI